MTRREMSASMLWMIGAGMEMLMRARTKWVAGGAAVLMLVSFQASRSGTPALALRTDAPSLAALTIRLGDLRPGYHVDARMRLGMADFAGFNNAKKAAVREHGCLVGYDVDFLLGSSAN